MRTTIYLTLAIAALFVGSSDAASLNKRDSNTAIASAKGSLNSFTGLAGAVSSNGQQRQQKKRDNPTVDVSDAVRDMEAEPQQPQVIVESPGSVDKSYGSYGPGPVVSGPIDDLQPKYVPGGY